MKPFNNVIVSAAEPKNNADVWIKHNYIKYNGPWQNITYGSSGDVQSNSKRLATDKIKLEKGTYRLNNPNNPEISPVAIAKFNEETFVELKANIKFPYELVVDDTFNQISLVLKKTNDGVITSGDVKNFEILSYENDILVNDNGVYNSILPKVIRNDLSNTKTAKVTQVIRAFDNVYGRIHSINIICKIQGTTTSDSKIFSLPIKIPNTSELVATDSQRAYRCTINGNGEINLISQITNETQISITGTIIV